VNLVRAYRPLPGLALAFGLVLAGFPGAPAAGTDLAARVADRLAVERVYYDRRAGDRPPFEGTVPRAKAEALVRLDLKKEAVLRSVYGVAVTSAMVSAEVRRIDAASRAPEVLAELKAALGNDPERFARAVARPQVVERELRTRFANDDSLHQSHRRRAAAARERLLSMAREGRPLSDRRAVLGTEADPRAPVQDIRWQRRPRPDNDGGRPSSEGREPHPASRSTAGAYRIEATARLTPTPLPGGRAGESESNVQYLADLHPDLQSVLSRSLQGPGDVSPVIEMPSAFLVYLAIEVSPHELAAAVLSIPKLEYREWLEGQPEPEPSARD